MSNTLTPCEEILQDVNRNLDRILAELDEQLAGYMKKKED